MLFSGMVFFYYLMVPIARQSANDLAALISLSAQTWVELPPHTRPDFEHELKLKHGITLTADKPELKKISVKQPFLLLLETALVKRLGSKIQMHKSIIEGIWIWIEVPIASRTLYIGFSHQRIGPNPPLALFFVLIGGGFITLITTVFFVKYLNKPLTRLSSATKTVGRGEVLSPLPESGPQELALLARSFNQMASQIQILLTSRTTLLAGISHDLRTPLARIQLAMEFLQNDSEQELIDSVKKDLTEMNQLIGRTLDLAKGFNPTSQQIKSINLTQMINKLIGDYSNQADIDFHHDPHCVVIIPEMVLHRILVNLLENAICYGNNHPIKITCFEKENQIEIAIFDRGEGIPEKQLDLVFQPFYRLESSRNTITGGSGLGLAIVRQLCDTYGWSIQLLPRDKGGTEARLKIDLVSVPENNLH